jgi:hypothetical protein
VKVGGDDGNEEIVAKVSKRGRLLLAKLCRDAERRRDCEIRDGAIV